MLGRLLVTFGGGRCLFHGRGEPGAFCAEHCEAAVLMTEVLLNLRDLGYEAGGAAGVCRGPEVSCSFGNQSGFSSICHGSSSTPWKQLPALTNLTDMDRSPRFQRFAPEWQRTEKA